MTQQVTADMPWQLQVGFFMADSGEMLLSELEEEQEEKSPKKTLSTCIFWLPDYGPAMLMSSGSQQTG